jgi:glucosyl-3-phosphoglycerate synthase
LISTLQRLNDSHLARIEEELCDLAREKKIALVLPCHAADLERPALAHIGAELEGAGFLDAIVLSINGLAPEQPMPTFSFATTVLSHPGTAGKGANVAAALAELLRQGRHDIIALHDCDVASFRRADLARLCYAVAHPDLGYRFAKAYYSRVTDRLYGRVSRLFLAPLLHAVVRVAGHLPLVDFLLSFRYPLAGEVAFTRELATQLPPASGWNIELSHLCEIFRHVDPRDVCQVDGGTGYDHKHQPAGTALAGMAAEIARELFAQLATEGVNTDTAFRTAIARAYQREAAHALRRSAALARINALPFDLAAEQSIVAAFATRLDAANS